LECGVIEVSKKIKYEFLLKINFFIYFIFFDVLISKINLKKYHFNAFLHEKIF